MHATLVQCEVCIDSVSGARAAEVGGADRLELCAGLIEGGTTPSTGMIRAVLQASRLPVMVMLRPRAGDFVYDAGELDVMCRDLEIILQNEHVGVVFGALTPDGHIDLNACRQLCGLAENRSLTFHRAFDHIRDPSEALEQVIELGFDRILTSGQEATAELGIPLLAKLVEAAGDRIQIMPGGGVRPENAGRIVELTNARQIHFSGAANVDSVVAFRRPNLAMGASHVPSEYERRVTSTTRVRAICESVRAARK